MLKLRPWVFALLTVPMLDAGAQSTASDSLIGVFDTTRQDTDRLQVLAHLAAFTRSATIADIYYPRMQELVERLQRAKDPATRAIAQKTRIRLLIWAGRLRIRATDYPGAVRYLDQAGRMATVLNDSMGLLWHASEMSDVHMLLGDTAGATRYGYRSAELALYLGDSSKAFEQLLGTSSKDTSKQRMNEVIELADSYFKPGRAQREYYLWSRAWTLTAHGEHDRAIADLLLADSLLAGRNDAFRDLVWLLLGEAYQNSGRTQQAIAALKTGIAFSERYDDPAVHAGCARALAEEEYKLGNYLVAESAWLEAVSQGHLGRVPEEELPALDSLRELYTRQNRFEEALSMTGKWLVLRDSMARMDATKDLMRFEFDAVQREVSLENSRRIELAEERLSRERTRRNVLLYSGLGLLVFGVVVYRQSGRIKKEHQRSEHLLLNILPAEVAEELKAKGESEAVLLDQVTVLFTDFKGFTAMSEQVTPKELVKDLHECFSAFDHIMAKHGIEKIKTIGDAYMAAGGLPTPNTTHALDVVKAALEIRDFIAEGKGHKIAAGLPYFEIRIGIHTGPVVAGIVGVKKFAYDIWGDTVNTASRMESSGEVGQVNISEATYALVQYEPGLTFTPRGKVQAKGKGEMEMYFVTPHAVC